MPALLMQTPLAGEGVAFYLLSQKDKKPQRKILCIPLVIAAILL
jgi:hypothetical protein